jgi:phosphoribosyl 1,2-cyclic phosphodiesterase/CheY-like chemotaxis protein
MYTVLIIDDEADYRQLLGEVLAAHGWKVLEADEGEKGLALAREHKPRVIVCDLLMPRCNGFQVCRAIRQDPALKHVKILVSSGRDFGSDRQAAREAGADQYLTKPMDLGDLVDVLTQLAQEAEANAPRPTALTELATKPARVKFWGVRGSIPTPGPATVQYGGNTSCIEVRADGQLIILDAGSGLRLLGKALLEEFGDQSLEMTLLLTHTHWDHIQGIPFFLPVYRPQNRLRILGYEGARHGLVNVLSNQMESPFFPVGLRELPANVLIEELKSMSFEVGSVRVQACFANHPGICVGYRLFTSEGSVAFFPDNEPHIGHRRAPQATGDPEGTAMAFARGQDQKVVEFLRGVDVMIMDAQYDCSEYRDHIGWGHGCVEDVVALALQAGAKRLFLFHHDPNHDDAKIAAMADEARRMVADRHGQLQVEASREGAVVHIGSLPEGE